MTNIDYKKILESAKRYDISNVAKLINECSDSLINAKYSDEVIFKDIVDKAIAITQTPINGYDEILPECLPCFTPDDMEALGVFDSDPNNNYYKVESTKESKDWYEKYKINGNPGIEWYDSISAAYGDLIRERTNYNKQRVLELGWNPEVEFCKENLIKASELVRKKLIKEYGLDIIDTSILTMIKENEYGPLVDTIEGEMTRTAEVAREVIKDIVDKDDYSWMKSLLRNCKYWNDDGTMSFLEYDFNNDSNTTDQDHPTAILFLIQSANARLIELGILFYRVVIPDKSSIKDTDTFKIEHKVEVGDLPYTSDFEDDMY